MEKVGVVGLRRASYHFLWGGRIRRNCDFHYTFLFISLSIFFVRIWMQVKHSYFMKIHSPSVRPYVHYSVESHASWFVSRFTKAIFILRLPEICVFIHKSKAIETVANLFMIFVFIYKSLKVWVIHNVLWDLLRENVSIFLKKALARWSQF